MSDNQSKMYAVAQSLGERIKGRDPYVVIHHFSLGCRFILTPDQTGHLLIGLFISPTAEQRYSSQCRLAKDIIEGVFGGRAKMDKWDHPANDRDTWKRVTVDVSNASTTELIEMANKLKARCA